MLCLNLSDIVIITVKDADYPCIIHDISKSDAIHLLVMRLMIVGIYKVHFKEIIIKNRVYSYYFNNLINAEKLETINILINEKIIRIWLFSRYFTRYVHKKAIKMSGLYYHKLMRKIEEYEGKILAGC